MIVQHVLAETTTFFGRDYASHSHGRRLANIQIPLDRIQKLSVHVSPAGSVCKPGNFPS